MIDLSRFRRVHFVGIGGIGMSALARYLHARGFQVTGSDRSANEQTEALSALGISVHIGHQPDHVGDADLVVSSSAVPATNPELMAAPQRGLTVVKRSILLAAIMNPMTGVAVAGTHGKSTTTALIAHLLLTAGLDATALIGGVSENLGSNARVGAGDLVVVEADEYDASFLHLRPALGVITNVEADHLDFYGTLERLHDAFRQFAMGVSDLLVVCADDPVLTRLVEGVPANLATYGLEAGDWRAADIVDRDGRTNFTVTHGSETCCFSMALAGPHNVRNALAAVVVADALGVSRQDMERGLAGFAGVHRRFERRGEAQGILVLDDYAHHPTEIKVNLAAMRERFRRPIRVVFQPHTYSRTHSLLSEFAGAFEDAGAVYVTDIYAAREENVWGIRSEDLAAAIAEHGSGTTPTHVCPSGSLDATLAAVARDAEPGDLVVTMGAGDVGRLGPELLEALQTRFAGAGRQ